MSKPSAGALRAVKAIRDIYGDPDHPHAWDHEYAASVLDRETALPEFIQLAYMIQQGTRLHDYCNACPTCGEKADRLIAQAEDREGT